MTADSISTIAVDETGSATPHTRPVAPMPQDRFRGWTWSLLVTAFGGWLRFFRLSVPRTLVGDEYYYVEDAWSILHHGTEWSLSTLPAYPEAADYLINSGKSNAIFATCTHAMYVGDKCGEYVAQPELGKELIAVGEAMFGLNPFGWRFMSAVFGTLAILLMCRIARRMTRSTLLGCAAGLLMSLDGLEFVMSRTGMLDIFLMFFVLAAFGCMVVDRDVARERLASLVCAGPADVLGPRLGIRKWRVWGGIFVGLAIAVKWNGVFYLLGLAILGTCWDIGARRAAGLPSFVRSTFRRDVIWLPLTWLAIPFVVYVATWSDWLISSTGYMRNYASAHGVNIPVISALYSLFAYHVKTVKFGLDLNIPQTYQSKPWSWLVMTRPMELYYQCYTGPVAGPRQTCAWPAPLPGPQYSQDVLAIGTPAIWWGSILALLVCLVWWLRRRDWRAGAVLACVAWGWLPWFPLVSRTEFFYYALEFEPFLILSITLCLGLIIGQVPASRLRLSIGFAVAGAYLMAVLLMFWYFYPLLAARVLPYPDWLSHLWYRTGWS